jgi:hypothetical protein
MVMCGGYSSIIHLFLRFPILAPALAMTSVGYMVAPILVNEVPDHPGMIGPQPRQVLVAGRRATPEQTPMGWPLNRERVIRRGAIEPRTGESLLAETEDSSKRTPMGWPTADGTRMPYNSVPLDRSLALNP